MSSARKMCYHKRAELFRAVIERNGFVVEIYGPYQRISDAKAAVTRNTTGWYARNGQTGRVETADAEWTDVPAAKAAEHG